MAMLPHAQIAMIEVETLAFHGYHGSVFPFSTQPLIPQLAELETWRSQLDQRTLVRSWEGRLRRDLEASAVAGSTGLEGVPVTADEV
ncbi:MAG: hypothetical protein AAB295_04575, partial [Chloroflexota bacterium]